MKLALTTPYYLIALTVWSRRKPAQRPTGASRTVEVGGVVGYSKKAARSVGFDRLLS